MIPSTPELPTPPLVYAIGDRMVILTDYVGAIPQGGSGLVFWHAGKPYLAYMKPSTLPTTRRRPSARADSAILEQARKMFLAPPRRAQPPERVHAHADASMSMSL
ncbi:hypothetical protein CR152_05265 [Massilia violaceinigra]|uniref:Uncharacterized protein n=1 Tax=Massilia violaceinigra TaxID=2045208 RepID=A0A2D2DG79_9BURK|nr:hypothetical protein [Massilia violaceinigra]ATQ73994.1 hypothetical protein CR152_05265 [Massilia violaceinigra]